MRKWGQLPIDLFGCEDQNSAMIWARPSLQHPLSRLAQIVIALAALLACATATLAQTTNTPMLLDDSLTLYVDAKPHLQYYRDPSLAEDAQAVIAKSGAFSPIESRYTAFGLTADRIWLKWDAQNTADKPRTFRIDAMRQYFTQLKLFEISGESQPRLLLNHKQEDSFYDRVIPSRFLLTDVTFQPGETKTFLIGYRSSTTTFLPLAIGTADGVNARHQSDVTVDLFLNGMLAAMIIYSLLMSPVIGWRLAASFAAYIGAGAFYVMVADGYPMQALWPNAAWVNEPMNLASMLVMTACGLNFCRQLFHFKEFAPQFDTVLVGLMALAAICAPLTFALIEQAWFARPAYFLPPLANICVCVAGIIAYQGKRIGALPFLFGASLVLSSLAYALAGHLVPGRFDLDATLDYGHFALLGECLAFAVAILIRFLSIRQQRDEALAAKLEATEQKLQMNQQLIVSQRNFAEAKSHAERGQQRLSEMSHDIRQPLLVLKNAVARLGQYEGRGDDRLEGVISYLEDVAREQANDQPQEESGEDPHAHQGPERFPARVLFESIAQLYSDAARSRGITLTVRRSDLEVCSNPVALMRALSNLVGNAITHSAGNRVLIGARKRGDQVRIEVWDNGQGLNAEQVSNLRQRGHKSETSDGSGLGLHIVERICAEHGHRFEFQSRKGSGSAAFIWV